MECLVVSVISVWKRLGSEVLCSFTVAICCVTISVLPLVNIVWVVRHPILFQVERLNRWDLFSDIAFHINSLTDFCSGNRCSIFSSYFSVKKGSCVQPNKRLGQASLCSIFIHFPAMNDQCCEIALPFGKTAVRIALRGKTSGFLETFTSHALTRGHLAWKKENRKRLHEYEHLFSHHTGWLVCYCSALTWIYCHVYIKYI